MIEDAKNSGDPIGTFLGIGPLPPIEQYRAPFDMGLNEKIALGDFEPEIRRRIESKIPEIKEKAKSALASGTYDSRKPLDEVRRAWFQQQISNFDANKYPEDVPEIFQEAGCNIFGHICPVFFASEGATETSKERRRGRYIPFETKIRVVRRDNYTCQHCKKHLRDDEVEFDHIIPLSRGGSSEEHNIRLTCYDCNRDKSDNVEL
jgi:hypothetical protein